MATPEEIIDDARGYADTIRGDAQREFGNLKNLLTGELTGVRGDIPGPFTIESTIKIEPPLGTPEPPTYEPHKLELPPDPEDHDPLDPIPPFEPREAPLPPDIEPPQFNLPSKPAELVGFTATPPQITALRFPEPPSELESPSLQRVVFGDHVAPVRPTMAAPALPGNIPVFDGQEPSNLAEGFGSDLRSERATLNTLASAYVDQMIAKFAPDHNAGMAKLEVQLARYMDGGTALDPRVEDAIYHRAEERNDREAERVQRAAFADVAARGFTLPTGALAATLARARMEAASNNSKAASDIAVAQAEMEQRNIQFAISTSSALRTTVMNLTQAWLQGILAINGQALESAKAVMAAVIEAYNTSVKVYTTRLEAWKSEVIMFDSMVKFELSKVEIYKAEISALEAAYDVDKAKVEQYKAEVSRLSSLADLYKSRIDAVMGNVALEKAKIDIFQTQAQAYSAQVQAKQSEWQAFSAEISGHTADVQAYRARMDAFNGEVQAYKTDIEGKVAVMSATSAKNAGIIDAYKARVASYSAAVQAESASNSANLTNERQKGLDFKSRLDDNSARYQMQMDYQRAEAARVLEEAKQKFERDMRKVEITLEGVKMMGAFANVQQDQLGGMAQAALSGLNVLAAQTETL